jgi:hypothetical protein
MTRKLLPARNIRRVVPRVCASCLYGSYTDGGFSCIRRTEELDTIRDGYACDIGDMEHYYHTCDLWTGAEKQPYTGPWEPETPGT